MSVSRIGEILKKDLRLGPRSPIFMWILILPVLITLVLQVAFGDLFESSPRLGVVDQGSSSVSAALDEVEGVEITSLTDVDRLKTDVESNDLDAGLVLAADFDRELLAGERPTLEFYVGGESNASDRIVLAVTTLDVIRTVEGSTPPVDVEIVSFGDEQQALTVRLVPFIVMYALLVAAVFLPAFSIADEREKGTLDALVVSPVRLSEVISAKGILGFFLAIAMAIVTLWLNGALEGSVALLVVLVAATLMLVQIGLIYGTASKDATGVFTLIKGTGIILLGPTIFYIFPDWPRWIAKLFPTYWIINPVYEITINQGRLADIWVEIGIGLGVTAVLVGAVVLMTRRLRMHLGIA